MTDVLRHRSVRSLRSLLIAGLLLSAATVARAQPPLTVNFGANLGPFSVGELQFGLVATGGTGTYTWEVIAGALPPGVKLRTDIQSFFPAGSSAGLIGIATTAGSYPVTIRVTSGASQLDQPTTIRVTNFAVRNPNQAPNGFVGQAYSHTLDTVNAAGIVTFTPNGPLPAGLSLGTNGVISGSPTATGSSFVGFSVSDGTDTIFSFFSISIYGVNITTELLPNATQNQSYSNAIVASGGTPPYTFTPNGGGLPFGLSMNANGLVTGTSTSGAGRYGFSVIVTDSTLPTPLTFTKNVAIVLVGAPKQLPVISPYGSKGFDDCTIFVRCDLGISVFGGGTAPFVWSATGLPSGLAIVSDSPTFHNAGDGQLTGLPLVVGDFVAHVTVTDADGATSTNDFPLHISAMALRGDIPSATLGSPFSTPLRVIGGSPFGSGPMYTAALVGGRLPEGLTFDPSTLLISGTSLENGFFQPRFQFIDSAGATLTTNFYFSVFSGGINIIHNGELGSFTTGSFFSQQLSACCVAGYSWSVTAGGLPPGLTLSTGGLLSGTLTTSGEYTFVIQASEVGNPTNVGGLQFHMIVTPINVTINSTLANGFVASAYNGPLTVTGATGNLTWTVVSGFLPSGLAITGSGTSWALSGTPSASGRFDFVLKVTDAAGHVATRSFNVSIYPAGVLPPVSFLEGPNFGTFSIGEINNQLTGAGGNGTYTFSVIAGSLPPGISIRTAPDLPPWFAVGASAGLIGIATTPGTYTFTLRVTSGTDHFDRVGCTIKITALATDDQYTLPNAFLSTAYSYALTPSGNAGPVTFAATGALPPGLSLSAAGVLSGTPTAAGFFGVPFSITDGTDTVFRTLNFTVFAIKITTPGELPNATQGQPYSTTIAATGGAGGYTYSTNCCLPSGLVLNTATGEISGTVTAGPGRYSFNFTVTDSNSVSFSKPMAIAVLGVPPALPSVSGFGNLNDCTFGTVCSLTVSVNNGGTSPYVWTVSGLPAGLHYRTGSANTSSYVTPGDVEIYGLPRVLGTFDVTVTVTGADGTSATQTFPLKISALTTRDFFGNGVINTPFSGHPRVLGGVPGYSASIVSGYLPAGVSFDSGTQTFSGTPLENGSFGITVAIADSASPTANTLRTSFGLSIGGGTSTININTSRNLGFATIGSSFSTGLSACCLPNPPGYTWAAGSSLPVGLAVTTVNGNGQISGTVDPSNLPGLYSFFVQASDPGNPANVGIRQLTLTLTSTTTVSITLPTSMPDGNVGTPYSQTITASGGTGTLTFALATGSNFLPPGLSLSSDGVISGTPTGSGQFFFSVTATDTVGIFATRFYNIAIYPAGQHRPLSLSIGTNFNASLGVFNVQIPPTSVTGGLGPYQFSLTPAAELPAGAAQIPGMRMITGPPFPTGVGSGQLASYSGVIAAPGVYKPSIRVTDSTGAFFDRLITITVLPLAMLSQTSLPKATRNVPYSFTFVPYGGSGNYSWAGVNLPPGMTIDASTGVISGTTTSTTTGFFFSIVLTDLSNGTFISNGFTLAVDPFAIETSGVLPSATAGVAYPAVTLAASGCGGSCSWISQAAPGGMSVSSSGVLSGTPNGSFTGTFTITASGSNGTVSKVFSLVILQSAFPVLTITNTNPGDLTIGSLAALQLTATGGTPPYAWSLDAGALPVGVTLVNDAQNYSSTFGPGMFYLTGRAVQPGVASFTLRVTDSLGAFTTKAMTVNVSRLSFQFTSLPVTAGANPANPLTYNVAYSQTLLALGGENSYPTWTNLAALPPGLSLTAATGVISGTPGNTGSFFNIPINVVDVGGNSITANVSFTIAGPTVSNLFFPSNNVTTTQGQQATFGVTPSGGTSPYTMTALTALPSGLVLSSGSDPFIGGAGSGQFSITGFAQTPGTYPVTLRAEDSAAPTHNIVVRSFTITVLSTVLSTPTALPDASVGTPYSQPLLAFDSTGAVGWSLASGSLMPPGLAISAGGIVSGTPTVRGVYSFALNITNGASQVTTRTFTLNVSAITITDGGVLPTAIVGLPYTFAFTQTGGGAAPVFTALAGLPAGLTLGATGAFSGAPQAQGSFSVLVSVTDGLQPLVRRFLLPVRLPIPPILDIGIAGTAFADMVVGQNTTLTLNAVNGAPPYTWSLASGSLPPGLQLVTGSAVSTTNFAPGTTLLAGMPTTPGSYAFDLIATDSAGGQVRRTYTVTVSPVAIFNIAPATAVAGVAYSARFAAFGGSGGYTFTMSPVSLTQDMLPPGFTLAANGTIAGTTTSTGGYSFILRAQDSSGNAFRRTFTLFVNSASGLRVTNLNPNDGWLGSGRQFVLATNGASTYSWTLVSGALPPGLSLVPNLAGPGTTSVAGAPTAAGTFTYTLRATDTANGTLVADHALSHRVSPTQLVSPPLEIWGTITVPSARVGTPYSVTLKSAGGTPPYAYALSPFSFLPPGLNLSAPGVISGTPTSIGTFNVVTIVSDSAGHTVNNPGFALVVTPAVGAPPLIRVGGAGLPDASAGLPFAFGLDRFVRGGTAPFAWSIAPATPALPAGLALLPGTNGVSTHIGGTPTTPGPYTVTLTVTDSSVPPQSLDVGLTGKVSALALTPDWLPPGVVGASFSQTLTPSGGTGPYIVQKSATSDIPPGVSFTGGILSGTPAEPGNFLIVILITDSALNTLTKIYRVTIDNAAGQSPAFSLTPKPIQVYYQVGSPNPAPIPVSVSTTSGALPFTLSQAGVPGASLSSSAGTTSTTVNLSLNLNSPPVGVGTYTGLLAGTASGSANLFDAVPIIVTVAPAPPCSYGVNPASTNANSSAGAGTFEVSAGPTCAWTAVPSDPWITVTAGASGPGNGTVSYSVAANGPPPTSQRTGTIDVHGTVFTITQFGTSCSFAISPLVVSATSSGGVATIDITASDPLCPWTASSGPDITLSAAAGTGTVSIQATVAANASPDSRVLTATVAGQTLTVNQTGISCTVSLSSSSAFAGADGITGSVDVTTPAGCAYNTLLGPSWISVTGATGTGPGTVGYSVDANSTTFGRSGTLTIGGQPFQITQDPLACSVTINTAGLGSPYAVGGGTGSVGITTNGQNCTWTASSGVPWATVTPGAGSGNATLGVVISSNAASTTSRPGSLTVGGQTINISQAGTVCSYLLQSSSGSAPAVGGAGSVGVVAPAACAWGSSSNAGWLTIQSSGSGGTSEVQFAAAANTSANTRVGTLTIAGLQYTVNQAGAPCSYTITGPTTSPLLSNGGATGESFGFSAAFTGCSPTAVSYSSWITIDPATSFSGTTGTVVYSVSPNPYATQRTGTILVGNASFTVVQSGANCAYSLNAYGKVFQIAGGSDVVLGTPTAVGCTPDVGTNQPSFIFLDPLTGPELNIFTLPYTVAPFPVSLTTGIRFGTITFGGQSVAIKQFPW